MAIDQHRTVYIAGYEADDGQDFPLKASLFPHSQGAQYGGFISTLTGSLSSIAYYSTLFAMSNGNPSATWLVGIAVDSKLNAYVTGYGRGAVKATSGALTSNSNIYVSKLVIMDDLSLALSASPGSVVHGGNLTYTIAVTSKGPDYGYNLRL